ncbi:DNA polymerase/3'-5' exonuclease PolX [Flammeovirga kamogawensis]|uniref:PHP domain-containing protein n=1 Tax=Flammeovirga kamogawensis TaxID=373891 RepID=A0ABX8GSG5_9BACT|nr:DNA polymerase/3'-5' exonuclease PolX [Flammeovirga kamogawensis]MBB6463713.1 DNA polymerase (family 10) [Flammeovirga kamogawensis]QWG06212.1 PHP domain-containing protein [Flammeovirga kamogawensis]TRX68043.1 DNA polymerase/3'-5' exonuclease PolX [Flammeovirga kamogawensis]
MTNKDIIKTFRLVTSLMELHGANPFKTRAYSSAIQSMENAGTPLFELSNELLIEIGLSKTMAEKLMLLFETGSFKELAELKEKTPDGVIEMMGLSGVGPKKIATLWKELDIDSLEKLKVACEENKVQTLKGFAAKTEAKILQQVIFLQENRKRLHYAKAEVIAKNILSFLSDKGIKACTSGELSLHREIVDTLSFTVETESTKALIGILSESELIDLDEERSIPLTIKGTTKDTGSLVEIYVASPQEFIKLSFKKSATTAHLQLRKDDASPSLNDILRKEEVTTHKEIYEKAGLPFFPPELREGIFDEQFLKGGIPTLVEDEDLRGSLHNHSDYSDGQNTLREMAEFLKNEGYEYLGISDHSKTAFYANGLSIERIEKQHQEIDELNKELAPFKIFKGIESDILPDGSLDYDDDVLATFDFIVASIHSPLTMTKEVATKRLITAIEHPATTILGHPTGRLLLRREGYPIDHKAVIDACAKNNVVIEINSSPWRLDLDWRWAKYALDQGVKLSLNPDAHAVGGYADMHFGLLVGRKAGLTKEMTLNALSKDELEQYFNTKKRN